MLELEYKNVKNKKKIIKERNKNVTILMNKFGNKCFNFPDSVIKYKNYNK